MRDDVIDKIIGANVRKKRTVAGFTQEGFGAAMAEPISAQQVSKYEIGENQTSVAKLVEFSRVLKCPIAEFFLGVDSPIQSDDEYTREDVTLMRNYKVLPDDMRESVRSMVLTLARGHGVKGGTA